MTTKRSVEINEPKSRGPAPDEYRQHLLNASNELYLHELLCLRNGRECSPALRRAHEAIRKELRRMEREIDKAAA